MKKFIKIILIMSLLCLLFSCNSYPFNKKEATNMAKNYISKKYNQEMNYLFTYNPPWWYLDHHYYEVYFSPDNNDELRFKVYLNTDLSKIGDNYLLVRFVNYSKELFQNKMNKIWNDINILILINSEQKYIINPPVEIDENMNPEDIRHYIGIYFIYIETNRILNELNMEEEASNIMEAIEIIKESGYEPDDIHFIYNNKRLTFWYESTGDTSGRKLQEHYYYWNMIQNHEELIKRINIE